MKVGDFIFASIFMALSLPGCANSDQYESLPFSTIEAKLDVRSVEDLEKLISQFAESNQFKFRVARVHPNEPRFSITMQREDSQILGVNPFEVSKFEFGIYPRVVEPPRVDEMTMLLEELSSALGGNDA